MVYRVIMENVGNHRKSEMDMICDMIGANVFTRDVMRQYLPEKEYEEVAQAMAYGGEISMQTADAVAKAMKDWAVERGATHYSHWFQPLTGATAESTTAFCPSRTASPSCA